MLRDVCSLDLLIHMENQCTHIFPSKDFFPMWLFPLGQNQMESDTSLENVLRLIWKENYFGVIPYHLLLFK